MKSTAKIKRILVMTMLIVVALSTAAFAKTKVVNKKLSLQVGAAKTVSAGSKSKWKTSSKGVVSVKAAKNGKKATLTAAGEGTAKITATFKNKKKKVVWTVTVSSPEAAGTPAAAAAAAAAAATAESGSSSGSGATVFSPDATNGMSATEASAYKAMVGFQTKYPEGTSWPNNSSREYYWNGGIWVGGRGCGAFAMELSDAAFGSAAAKKVSVSADNVYSVMADIKVGDILRINGDTHSVIVMQRTGNGVKVAEGNYDAKVHWGREFTFSALASTLNYVVTRY